MASFFQRNRLWIFGVAPLAIVAVVIVLLIAGVVALAEMRRALSDTAPEVILRSPKLWEQVSYNEFTMVHAIARDQDGIVRAELWVNNELVAREDTRLANGSEAFPMLEPWQPKSLGRHVLVVRAFDSTGKSGQASVIVDAIDLPPHDKYKVQVTAGGAEAESVPPEVEQAFTNEHPELTEALESGRIALVPLDPEIGEEIQGPASMPEPFPGEEAPPPISQSLNFPWLAGPLGRLFNPAEQPMDWLEVEGLSLEVDRPYYGVYCYVGLGDQGVIRIPGDGFLSNAGGQMWSVDEAMAGANRRLISVPPEGQPLKVSIECIGTDESGMEAYNLGRLETTHFSADWDGRRLEKQAAGTDGWFRVTYRISPPASGGGAGDFPQIVLWGQVTFNEFLNVVMGNLTWDLIDGNADAISGYVILRDDAPYIDLPITVPAAANRNLPLSEGGGIPPCGQSYVYKIFAYNGDPITGDRSYYSNPLVFERNACMLRFRVKVEGVKQPCLNGDCHEAICVCAEGGHEGDSYAKIWIDDHLISLGAPEVTLNWEYGHDYSIEDMVVFGDNPAIIELHQSANLSVKMEVWDADGLTSDDLQAGGLIEISHEDLPDPTPEETSKKTYELFFDEYSDGYITLVLSVEALPPPITPGYEGPSVDIDR